MSRNQDRYTPQKRREYTNQYRDKRRQEAKAKLGGVCIQCGSSEQLEFDHIDPASKVMSIAKMWTSSKVKFEEELSKCQLLCKDCHIEKSRVEATVVCPSFARYDSGCRCGPCKTLVNNYKRDWKQSRSLIGGRADKCCGL